MGPFFMCSCVLLSSGRLGSVRAEVGVGFAVVSWFRRFRPPPPPLVWFRVRRPPLFFSLALSGFARSGPGVSCWCFSSLFSCVPLFASWLSNWHFIFTFISLSLSFHLPRCCGACVCIICIDVKLHIIAGGQQPIFLCCPTKLRKMWWMGSWTHEPVPAFYTYIVLPLGAFKTPLGGIHIYFIAVGLYGQCLLWLYDIIRLYIYRYSVNFIRVN